MGKVFNVVIQFAAVLFAISLHETAHAWSADKCGDPTARRLGRVTLNPLAHIDLFGTILFPILLAVVGAPVFGWAKPVPVNPGNFRNRRRDGMIVAAAGPLANILASLAIIALLLAFFQPIMNASGPSVQLLLRIATFLLLINLFLAIFNLIPIPPLDGSGILEGLLRGQARVWYERIKPYGFFILLFVMYTRIFDRIADLLFRLLFTVFPKLVYLMLKGGAVG